MTAPCAYNCSVTLAPTNAYSDRSKGGEGGIRCSLLVFTFLRGFAKFFLDGRIHNDVAAQKTLRDIMKRKSRANARL